MTNLEGQRMERTYMLGNLVLSETRFDGSTVSYSYDSNANIARAAYPGEALAFTHDADGSLTSASNTVGVVSNEYDSVTGWLVSSHGADGVDVSYTYHLGGGVASISSLAGVVSNTLDVAGRKDKLFTPAGNIGFGYALFGKPRQCFQWLNRGFKKCRWTTIRSLAKSLYCGYGVRRNIERAKELYKEIQRSGNEVDKVNSEALDRQGDQMNGIGRPNQEERRTLVNISENVLTADGNFVIKMARRRLNPKVGAF